MLGIVHALNQWPPELIWVLQLVFCYAAVLFMLRLFGKAGLFVFISISVIAANLQVLKIVQFSFINSPVALGTVLFSATYLTTDILAEYYTAKDARRGIYLGFISLILMLCCMTICLGFHPLSATIANQENIPQAAQIQGHLLALFTPTPELLLAGLTSFLLSQLFDLWLFRRIRTVTGNKWLWLRNNLSTMLAALLDNTVFSILAWRLLADKPLPWHAVIFSYILGTYVIRMVVAALDTPFIYLAKYFIPADERSRS